MNEIPLSGGWVTAGVVRVGETVRRPPGPKTELVSAVMLHLERIGFDAAPRFLGYDDRGRETLSFIPGDVPHDCRALVFTDEQLRASARLLRRYHDAVTSFPGAAEVVCHNDYGPWNLVWRDEVPVAMIDFDNVAPGPRVADVGYAVWKHLNIGLVDVSLPEQSRRLREFTDAYGIAPDDELLNAIRESQELMSRVVAGTPAVNKHVEERRWLAAHGRAFIEGA